MVGSSLLLSHSNHTYIYPWQFPIAEHLRGNYSNDEVDVLGLVTLLASKDRPELGLGGDTWLDSRHDASYLNVCPTPSDL